MEGMRLSTRRTFFLLYGVASLFLFLASTYYADARINDAILEWKRSQELVKLISEIHEAVTLIEAKKDVFLQGARSPSIESVEKNLKEVLIKLRKIHQFPESKAVSPVVSTLRDGLLQYNDQFSKITKIKDGKATKLLNGTINKDAVISKSGLEEFGEILAYVMPNMEQLILFSGKLGVIVREHSAIFSGNSCGHAVGLLQLVVWASGERPILYHGRDIYLFPLF